MENEHADPGLGSVGGGGSEGPTVAAAVEGIPEPGLELNSGPPTKPRPAASVILLRGGSHRLELLLVKRNPRARFMGGAWVFPGGAVNEAEGGGQAALRAAAVRELREEAGITLAPDAELVPFARWITPREVRMRFDAWFYLTPAPAESEPSVDGAEVVAFGWYSPSGALDANAAGDLHLAFPTIRQLQQLSAFASAAALVEHARGSEVTAVEPRVRWDGETARIVLPGES
jgi:8-oxo-dGTP pyrophosphatase MutT (NUDIX family)